MSGDSPPTAIPPGDLPLPNLIIPRSSDEPYVAGATLFGILAFPPTAQNDRKFQSAADVLCREVLLRGFRERPGSDREPRLVTPAFLAVGANIAQRIEADTRKRLHERMAAAQAVMPLFQQAERVMLGGAPAKHRRTSVDGQSARVIATEAERQEWLAAQGLTQDRHFPSDANNLDNRLIKPTLPVLHLAVATAIVMDLFKKALQQQSAAVQEQYPRDMGGPQVSLERFLEEPEMVEMVVSQAASLTQLLSYLPRLQPKPETMVHVTMAPPIR